MEIKEKIWRVLLPILILAGFVLLGFASWHLMNSLRGNDSNETSSSIDEKEEKENTKELDDKQAKAYTSLTTIDKSYGFYFNEDVSIDKISDYNMIKYALNNYVKENNISLESDLVCLEFEAEYCDDVTFPTVKSDTISKYLKDKFNTSRNFSLTPDNVPDQYIDSEEYVVMPIHDGFCNYNFSKKVYSFGTIATGGMYRKIHTKLYKTEEDGDKLYFYDKAFVEETGQGYISLMTYLFDESSVNDNEFFSYDTEDSKKHKEINIVKEDGTKIYSVNVDYIFEKYDDKLTSYKHTFKKVNGNYYWVSSEIVK